MKTWAITTRAFFYDKYLKDLERTIVCKDKEEAEKRFDSECYEAEIFFWDGMEANPYEHTEVDDNTYVLTSDEAMCVVTKREVEL